MDVYKPSTLSINGKIFSKNMDFNLIEVYINEIYLGKCSFNSNFSTCDLPISVLDQKSTILKIDFKPAKTIGITDLDPSGVEYQVGFGLISLSLK